MLSSSLDIYVFRSWGAPHRLASDLIDTAPGSPDAPVQIECGWDTASVLTRGGNVLIWWPYKGQFDEAWEADKNARQQRARDGDSSALAHATKDAVIPCQMWELHANPTRLPDLPKDLPVLNPEDTGESEGRIRDDPETRIIRIAALQGMLVALTNRGHVLKIQVDYTTEPRLRHWEYVSTFWIR